MSTLLTVVMPVFNGGKYLREAVQSVRNQTLKSWKLYIVDDGSTDETQSICEEFETLDYRIKYLRYDDQRVSPAENWNRAFRLVETEFMMMFHQDDIMHSELLERELYFMQSHSDMVWVSCRGPLIDLKGNVVTRDSRPVVKPATLDNWDFEKDQIFEGRKVSELLMWRVFFHASSCMLRTKRALSISLFNKNLRLLFDAEYYSRLSETGMVGYLAKELIFYRHHSDSGMSNTYSKGLNGIEAYVLLTQYCERHNYSSDERKRFFGLHAKRHAEQALRLAKVYREAGDRKVASMQLRIAVWFCEWSGQGKITILSKWLCFCYTRGRYRAVWRFMIRLSLWHYLFQGSLENPYQISADQFGLSQTLS